MKIKGKSTKAYRLHLVVKLSEQGHTQSKIAELTGLSQGRVSQILKAYRTQGTSALLFKTSPGRPCNLSQEQLEELKQLLQKGAIFCDFATQAWTLSRISLVIEQRFGPSYSLEHIRRILKKIGFTRQRPIAKDYRKDEQAVEKWKTQTLPALKKSSKRRL